MFETEDGRIIKQHSFTNAVKHKRGFCPVFTARFTDLEADCYNITSGDSKSFDSLGDYEPKTNTLVAGLFVGHRIRPFPAYTGKFLAKEFKSRYFRIVIPYCLSMTPSTPFGNVAVRKTFDPQQASDDIEREQRVSALTGWSILDCIDFFMDSFSHQISNQIGQLRETVENDELRQLLTEMMDQIPTSPFFIME